MKGPISKTRSVYDCICPFPDDNDSRASDVQIAGSSFVFVRALECELIRASLKQNYSIGMRGVGGNDRSAK